jgi:hypothetical protein
LNPANYAQKVQDAKDRAQVTKDQIIAGLRQSGAEVQEDKQLSILVDGICVTLMSGTEQSPSWQDTASALIEWKVQSYLIKDRMHRHPERKSGGWDVNKIVVNILEKVKAAVVADQTRRQVRRAG